MSDPRKHRHVHSFADNRLWYTCGCVNEVHPSGVLHSVEKCPKHKAESGMSGLAYYERLGRVDASGRGLPSRHVEELTEALGPIPPATAGKWLALEIGGGCSAYCQAILDAGYSYEGIEPDPWAASWTADTYGVACYPEKFEDVVLALDYSLILAAHSLEHMQDAPGAIRKCASLLMPAGQLWIVVPDDEDPLNPDHLWYFDPSTLTTCLESSGLVIDKLEVRRIVKHEAFIYARCTKP